MMARLTIMDTKAAIEAGRNDGHNLITELCNLGKTTPEQLFMESLSEIIALSIECRSGEASARLSGYAGVIAPMLAAACDVEPEIDEFSSLRERIAVLETKCALYAAALRKADEELIRINKAVQSVTESEGGEL